MCYAEVTIMLFLEVSLRERRASESSGLCFCIFWAYMGMRIDFVYFFSFYPTTIMISVYLCVCTD